MQKLQTQDIEEVPAGWPQIEVVAWSTTRERELDARVFQAESRSVCT